jgi:hypothetical protein
MEAIALLNTWESMIVAVLGAVLWALPFNGRWELWHHSVGLLLVLAVAVTSALIHQRLDAVVNGAIQGMAGLGVSWVLVEATIQASAFKKWVESRRRPPEPPPERGD